MPPKQLQGEEKRCSHCASSHTSGKWRRHPTSGQRLCGACRVYADSHGGQLPPDSVLQRRPAEPRRLEEVRRDVAQRRCLQCGSASPGNGRTACWCRHPATGEEWLCVPCYSRIYDRLKGRTSHARKVKHTAGHGSEVEKGQQQPGQNRRQRLPASSSDVRSSEEGEQALAAPLRLRAKRKWQQEQQAAEGEAPPAFHAGPASAAREQAHGSMPGGAAPAGGSSQVAQPAAQRRQRRKQAQPQHLPQQLQAQPEQRQSLPATVLIEGAEEAGNGSAPEEPPAASMRGAVMGAGAASVAAGMVAAAGDGSGRRAGSEQCPLPLAQPPQQAAPDGAARQAVQQEAAADPADERQALFDLLEQAMDVAAAAACGLTPELVAAFAALPPLDTYQEGFMLRLLQRNKFSAAAAFMTSALRGAGRLPPATS